MLPGVLHGTGTNMRHLSVTLHEEFGASGDAPFVNQEWGYRIGGLPDGATYKICKGADGRWRMKKVGIEEEGEWSEPLPSFDAALDMVLSAYR